MGLLQRQLCGYFRDKDESTVEAVMGLFLLPSHAKSSLGTRQILCDGNTKRRETEDGKLLHVSRWCCFYAP
jgi:hypothetical protein